MTRVRFMPEADAQRDAELNWWLEHRPKNPFLFWEELNAVVELLETAPNAGAPYRPRKGVRRCLLPGSRYHVYYTYDPAEDEVLIHAVWGAQRRRGPPLRR